MPTYRSVRLAIVVATALVQQGCGGSDGGSGPGGGATPASLSLTTPPSASAQNRVAFVRQPVVQLRGAGGSAIARAGVAVTVSGGALLGTTTVTTASDGSATFTNLAAAGRAGQRMLTFSSPGLASVTATVALVAGLPASIAALTGEGQWALPGSAVPTAPSVIVFDADSNAVSGVPVTFAVTGGGGSFAGASLVTDASGIAAAGSWTLGSAAGLNTLSATAASVPGSPVGFTATATTTGTPVGPSFSTGAAHSCTLTTTGAAYCWGRGEWGQLGVATPPNSCTIDTQTYACSLLPVAVQGGLAFTLLEAGSEHTCGLTSAGPADCWGHNNAGQLGDNSTNNQFNDKQTAPAVVAGGLVFATISAGPLHTCGLTSGGAAYCWGANPAGQLGDGTIVNRPVPVAVTGGLSFVSITTGGYGTGFTCALTSGGAAYCWGENILGQLGIGSTDGNAHTAPVPVSGGIVFTSLSADASHVCGLTATGSAWCWGANVTGSLGDGTEVQRTAPVAVAGGIAFMQITTGGFSNVNAHTCAVTSIGQAYCWGDNAAGALGDGSLEKRLTPTAVAGPVAFARLAAGFRHSCGRSGTGALYCWGSNGAGQLGVNSTSLQSRPAKVQGIP